MIGAVIATHGELGKAFLGSAELLVGKQANVEFCGLFHGDSIEGFTEEIKSKIEAVNDGGGVLVFTDVFGGSPCNATMRQLKDAKDVYCISGVNLPMLLEFFVGRNIAANTAQELYLKCAESGMTGIKKVKDLL